MQKIAVVLHNIRSVHNVGSIFRTADAAGVKKIYLSGITPAPLDRFGRFRKDFVKVSLGAEKYLKWEKVGSTSHILDKLKKENYKIFAVEQSPESTPYYKITSGMMHHTRIVLVFGSEIGGLPPSILRKVDTILEIPMRGKKESLNVSVAFGIVVFGLLH